MALDGPSTSNQPLLHRHPLKLKLQKRPPKIRPSHYMNSFRMTFAVR